MTAEERTTAIQTMIDTSGRIGDCNQAVKEVAKELIAGMQGIASTQQQQHTNTNHVV